jgi:hypothetical protein
MKKSKPFAKIATIRGMLKNVLKKYASYLSTIIILFCCTQSYGQITITTNPANLTSTILAGNGFNATISATAVSANPVTLSVSSDIDAGSGLHFANLNPAAGSPLQLQAIGAGSPLSGTWTFSVIATATGEAPAAQDFILTVRKPIDLMFILDNSGSMGINIDGIDTRWTKLKSGVAQFLANYQPNLTPSGNASGDQMGIRMFNSTDAAPVNPPFNVNSFIPVTPSTNTANALGGDAPGGNTAMGAGLETGKTFLFPAGVDNGHKKVMLLFTDGEQNTPPPLGNVVANAGTNPSITGIDPDLTNGDKIQINTIGLGVAGSASQALYNIAHESGVPPGIANIPTPASAPQLDPLNFPQALINISQQLLSGSSPQFVDVRRSKFKLIGEYYGAKESFTVSKKIDKIFINVISNPGDYVSLSRIEKDGKILSLYDSSYVKSKGGAGWQTFIISVSGVKKKIPAFTSDGNWVVTLSNESQSDAVSNKSESTTASNGSENNTAYIMSFTVDDHNSKMVGTTTQTKELVVGDKLPLSISLTKKGTPITNANAIAIIAKPGEDLGDLLARTTVSIKPDTGADPGSAGTQKYQQLLKDSAFVKKLLDSNHTVNLTYDASKKAYVGEFNQLDVSGVYQIAYIVSDNDASLGTIKRYAEESVYIRFPAIDLANSNIAVATVNNVTTITFRPIATNNKYVGPGWAGAIVLKGTGGENMIGKIIDNGDGSYAITVKGALSGQGSLTVGGATVYQGNLGDLGKPENPIWKQWWLWLLFIILAIIIWITARKKKNP